MVSFSHPLDRNTNSDCSIAKGAEFLLGRKADFTKPSVAGVFLDLTEFKAGAPPSDPSGSLASGDLSACACSPATCAEPTTRSAWRGVEFLSPPAQGEAGMVTIAICKDPDGTLIELLEIHPAEWPVRPEA